MILVRYCLRLCGVVGVLLGGQANENLSRPGADLESRQSQGDSKARRDGQQGLLCVGDEDSVVHEKKSLISHLLVLVEAWR